MPIVDYEKIARRNQARILKNEKISPKNKEILNRFLERGGVSPARDAILLERIVPLLERFPDLESALSDRCAMNKLFKELRARCAASSFATYVNVTRCFLRWLNDGESPSSLKDITPPPKAATRRHLDPEELLVWDDVLSMIQGATSIQMKALVAVQFDGGFRPSEFCDLNVGNVKEVNGSLVISVKKGKTGQRAVILHRSSDHLRGWLEVHPSRSPQAPLWLSEPALRKSPAAIVRYRYPAMRWRVTALAKRAGIKKATDFYGLRHASCAADKRDNLPIDIGAQRHGHSVKHFTETYGALSIESNVQRVQQHYATMRATEGSLEMTGVPPAGASGGGFGQELVRLLLNEMNRAMPPGKNLGG